MLEDCTMEKKSGRSNQLPLKGNSTETKKYPDTVGNKIFPRTSRRREPFNPQGTKYEASRKPLPQKNKSLDKRPRPRGQYYGCGKEDTEVAEDDEIDLNSVLTQGSKKQNLNHLLNFHYAPREQTGSMHQNWRPGGWGRSSSKWLMATHKHKYNKEQFLQANCQFVVKSTGNYSAYMENPDMLVDWGCIEQIRLRSPELFCPICLYPPVAAKMTRCGHVYCWSCILHYLALSDKTWRKCPICYEAVHKHDLRSVMTVPHAIFSVGEEITFRLMKRRRGSLIALPASQSDQIHCADKFLSVSETGVDMKYSKLLLASYEEVKLIIDKERCELEEQLAENQGCPEVCFIEQALELLKQRADTCCCDVSFPPALKEIGAKHRRSTYYGSSISLNDDPVSEDLVLGNMLEGDGCQGAVSQGQRERNKSMNSEDTCSKNSSITVEDIEASGMPVPVSKDFYFYQATDGQHIYLHAVNVRMLEYFYGSLKNCPLTLHGEIVEKESGSMTEELRQRLRYLQHLPVTCQFEVAEILLKPPVVNKETMKHFHDQLESRKRQRLRRARDERRREKRITEEENRRWGRFPSPRIAINSHQQFPLCGLDMENTGLNVLESASSEGSSRGLEDNCSVSNIVEKSVDERSLGNVKTCATATSCAESPSGSPSGPSFAQMLREGKSRLPSEWPLMTHGRSGHNESREPKENVGKVSRNSDSESESERYVCRTSFRQSLSDAITEAMEQAALSAALSASAQDDLSDISRHSGKKKKKQKQKLLFATGLVCKSK